MSKEKCTLSNAELIDKAIELVNKLASTGGKSWSLSVPVDFNRDPDMIFIELCKRLRNSVGKDDLIQWMNNNGEPTNAVELNLYKHFDLWNVTTG